MYDDWAYRAETTSQPPTSSPTLKPSISSTTRPRARSLLQSVAIGEDKNKNKNKTNGKISGGSTWIPSDANVPVRRARSLTRDKSGRRKNQFYKSSTWHKTELVNGDTATTDSKSQLADTINSISTLPTYPFTKMELFQLDNLIDIFDENDYEIEIDNALNDFITSNSYELRYEKGSSLSIHKDNALTTANLYPYLSFIQSSNLHSNSCNHLIQTCDSILDYLDELSKGFRLVRLETTEFESACHNLISEQTNLSNLSKDVENNLEIFTSLEKAMRVLHSPGSDLPGKSSFKPLLTTLDRGLEYFNKNPNILDMDLYQMRYRQCLTRALTLAVEYFNNRLNNNVRNIETKINENKNLNPTAHSALIYATFESDAFLLKDIANEIYIRSINNKEYNTLYDSCLYTYFGLRKKLLAPIINKNFQEVGESTLFVQTCRSNLSFFQEEIYNKEIDLFQSFFTSPLGMFENWLIDLSEPLYDLLRQKIIREHNIDNLCELTSLLLTYKEEDDISSNQLYISKLFQPILEDVQSRLVFRVQTSIEQDIVKYVPKTSDVITLGGRRKSSIVSNLPISNSSSVATSTTTSATTATTTTTTTNASNTPDSTPTPPILSKEKEPKFDTEQIIHDLYPPMRKAVSLLARIYQLVNSKVFDDIAHTIVHESLSAIKRAQSLATTRLGPIEADLFIVKNLLMLQSQVSEYEIDNIPAEIGVDFSGLQEVFWKIRQEGVSFASSNLLNLARSSVPKVVNNMFDAKEELYAELRNSIHDLTQNSVTTVAQSIINKDDPSTALEDTRKLRQESAVELPRIRSIIENYISDQRTIDVLMDSIQDLVIQTYEAYHQQIISKTSNPEQIDGLMEVDGLVSWLGDIVGRLHSTTMSNRNSIVSR